MDKHAGETRVERLRREFDARFAAPALLDASNKRDVLLLRARSRAAVMALPVDGLGLLQRAPRLAPLPGARAGLLGLASLRGRLCPVFDLGAALQPTASSESLPWLVALDRELRLALAFAELLALRQINAEQLRAAEVESGPGFTSQVLIEGGAAIPVLDPAALRAAFTAPSTVGETEES